MGMGENGENTNCLAGIKCPQCGNEDRFSIMGTSLFIVTDDGAEQTGDIEWDENSLCVCYGCYRKGKLSEFQMEEEKEEEV